MAYQVIARKYRPATFAEVIGQEPIVRTLKNAVEQNLVAHAYIFSGTRGVGKTTTARILAKALNCQKGPTTRPCGECPPCREIAAGTAVDVLEIDAASNRGIDEIRELRQNVRYLPARDPYKVFIIDEAHMLTTEAFNALLKTLEEPPPRVLFILATTEPHRMPSTIHSRCQSFHFRSISFQEILDVLARVGQQESARVEPEGLAVMARVAEGSLRDALSILDQAIAYCGKTISAVEVRELLGVVSEDVLAALVDAVAAQSPQKVLRLVDALVRDGHNLQHFCREALRHIRNLLILRIGGPAAALAEASEPEREMLAKTAGQFSEEDLLRFFQILLRTENELRWSPHPRLHLELGLLKLVQAERLVPLEEVLAELTGNPAAPAAAARPEAARTNPPTPVSPEKAEAAPPGEMGAAKLPPKAPAGARVPSVEPATIEAIKTAVYGRSKFLGSFVDSVTHWERENESLNLWFTPENRSLTEMLGKRQQGELEKIISEVLGEPVRVYPKVASGLPSPPAARPGGGAAKNPVVQALLDRFGGSVQAASDVARGPGSEPEE